MSFTSWLILSGLFVMGLVISHREAKKTIPDQGTGVSALSISAIITIVIVWLAAHSLF